MKHIFIDKIKLFYFVITFIFSINSYSQNTFVDKTTHFFNSIWQNIPQEKVYLHTDKPYYSSGENIWFKAYLIDAATHLPNARSKFVYVELINSFDSVITRVKIRKDSLGISGCINLKPDLAAGTYVLRAYTYWMQNTGSDFFYTKQLKIGNNIDDRLFTNISFGKAVNGYQSVNLQLVDVNSKPIAGKVVKLFYSGNKNKDKPFILKSNVQGEVSWRIPADTISTTNDKFISMSIDEPSLKYNKQFNVPSSNDDFDVQFFPESGNLIEDVVQTIAFKVIGTNGMSQNATGKLYDNANNEVVDLSTLYKGMGKFSIYTQATSSYYAILKNDKGLTKRFDLPTVHKNGVAIQLVQNKGRILYEIKNQLQSNSNSLYLLVHSRGILYVLQKLHYVGGQINDQFLPPGIVSFSVVDSIGNVYAERLCFINNPQVYNINIKSDKNEYKKRDLVQLNINLENSKGMPLVGNYSISVTNSKLVAQDSTDNNINTHFLLTSDLKGYIEEPTDYFFDNTLTSREKLDLLMLTQGWRRFDLKNYIQLKPPTHNYYMEMGQAISGKVLNIANKPSKNCDILLLSSYNNTFRMSKTDSLGRFVIDGFEFPDSTMFILKARKKKAITDVEIITDSDVFPTSKVFIPYKPATSIDIMSEYLKSSKEKYYTEGGMRMINLDEITVTASAKPIADENPLYAGADTKIGFETLEKFNGMSVLNYLQTVPGVMVMGETISIRGSQGIPLVLIDGFETESTEELNYLTTTDIEDISIFKGPSAAIFGSRGGNGAIAITLRKGITVKSSTPISLSVVQPLGFQKPTQFYMPKYNVPEVLNNPKPDLRTTVFWTPSANSDANGKINIEFYTSDYPHNSTVIIEGVSNNGDFIHKSGVILFNEKVP